LEVKSLRNLFHPSIEQLNLATVLNALSDPIRLNIVKNLSINQETTCSGCNIQMSKSTLSHHFKVLRESGIVQVRIDGKQRFLSIRYDDLEAKFPNLIDTIIKNI